MITFEIIIFSAIPYFLLLPIVLYRWHKYSREKKYRDNRLWVPAILCVILPMFAIALSLKLYITLLVLVVQFIGFIFAMVAKIHFDDTYGHPRECDHPLGLSSKE